MSGDERRQQPAPTYRGGLEHVGDDCGAFEVHSHAGSPLYCCFSQLIRQPLDDLVFVILDDSKRLEA